jgi:hypothetical protein
LQVFKDEYGELGLAAVRGSRLHLFEPVVADDYEDTATWSEYREIDLDVLLPPPNPMSSSSGPLVKKQIPVGFHEDRNTIFLETWNGVFALQLQSLKVKKILDAGVLRPYRNVARSTMIPYMSFFARTRHAPYCVLHEQHCPCYGSYIVALLSMLLLMTLKIYFRYNK